MKSLIIALFIMGTSLSYGKSSSCEGRIASVALHKDNFRMYEIRGAYYTSNGDQVENKWVYRVSSLYYTEDDFYLPDPAPLVIMRVGDQLVATDCFGNVWKPINGHLTSPESFGIKKFGEFVKIRFNKQYFIVTVNEGGREISKTEYNGP